LRGDFPGFKTHRLAPSRILFVPGKVKMFARKAVDSFVSHNHIHSIHMVSYFVLSKNTGFYDYIFNKLQNNAMQRIESIVFDKICMILL
jgi:hypothetical protein